MKTKLRVVTRWQKGWFSQNHIVFLESKNPGTILLFRVPSKGQPVNAILCVSFLIGHFDALEQY